jgi:hypothetical protein
MDTYWNPLPEARRYVATLSRDPFGGVWADRRWRNVPGPFYAAETDCMQLGRRDAPYHIAYDDDLGEGGYEFVYRQPTNAAETRALVNGAMREMFQAYGCDGDEHWTVDGVRDWWHDRHRVREWAAGLAAKWPTDAPPQHRPHYEDASRGLADFVAYIDDGLERYLRGYMFWLAEGRTPVRGDAMPTL